MVTMTRRPSKRNRGSTVSIATGGAIRIAIFAGPIGEQRARRFAELLAERFAEQLGTNIDQAGRERRRADERDDAGQSACRWVISD
jgi:hypothetical protein